MNTQIPDSSSENVVWAGTPSQKGNLGIFIVCALVAIAIAWIASVFMLGGAGSPWILALLVLPAAVAAWRWLVTRNLQYTLTDQRLKTRRGVFNRVTDDIELYRVKDSHFTQPFLQRMLGIGTITLRTTDVTTPIVRLVGMDAPEPLWERMRALVEARRDAKGVREIDMNAEHQSS
ncbi:MAG: PH domain-containing protein [Lysobacteraceae bacterium]